MTPIDRRSFLKGAALGTAGYAFAGRTSSQPASQIALNSRPLKRTYRAAAIGSTGRGNFGHGLDVVFRDLPNVEFVAIADDNPDGLKKAGERNGISRLYRDYREMLAKERPDVVSVAMRQSVWHERIVIDCAKAGAHIFCEKPLAPDLAAADRMLAACRTNGVKMAIAVQNRVSPAVRKARELVQSGALGRILSVRGRGKEDHRGGGEDLMVLGFHIVDLMRYFVGEVQWTFAHVMQDGRDMVKSDAHEGTEPNGLMAGDTISAMYGFENGVHGFFETHRNLKKPRDRFCLEIHGSEGVLAFRSLKPVMWFKGPVFNPAKPHQWEPIVIPEWEAIENKGHWCNRQLVLDLLHAVEADREPIASGEDGRWALEMILSVYQSHLERKRIPLPMRQRTHPLA